MVSQLIQACTETTLANGLSNLAEVPLDLRMIYLQSWRVTTTYSSISDEQNARNRATLLDTEN